MNLCRKNSNRHDLNSSIDAIVLANLDNDTIRSVEIREGAVNENFSEIKTYKIRWYILLVICLINISNAINGFCYTSIADFTGRFYSVDYTQVNLLSTISMVIIVPAGFISFIIIDYFGIRSSLIIAGLLNFFGTIFSVLSSVKQANNSPLIQIDQKYSILMTGQVFCSIATPFSFLVTTKFANTWFSPNQRALANTIALVSATFGVLIGALVSPLIVNSETEFGDQMSTLNSTNCVISLVPAVLSVLINRSTPPTPPTQTIDCNEERLLLKFHETFCINLKQTVQLFKSIQFLILFFTFSICFGLFNTLAILLQQMLCVKGYTDQDVGIFSGIMIGLGIIGSLVAGVIVDKTKRFEEVAKICFSVSSLANLFFAAFQSYNNDEGLIKNIIISAFCIIGISGLPLLPICMEMSVECVRNVSEATSTGLLLIGGQLVCIIMVMVYPSLATEIQQNSNTFTSIQKCIKTNSLKNSTSSSLTVVDYNNLIWNQSGVYILVSILFVVFFKCPYLRLRSECIPQKNIIKPTKNSITA